jgi:hypothetical protein
MRICALDEVETEQTQHLEAMPGRDFVDEVVVFGNLAFDKIRRQRRIGVKRRSIRKSRRTQRAPICASAVPMRSWKVLFG